MIENYEDFKEDFLYEFDAENFETVDTLIGLSLEEDDDKKREKSIGDWSISTTIEKHDRLNESFHFSLSNSKNEDIEICLTFYTGIDVGCELVDYSLEGESILNEPKYVDVLDDLKIDEHQIKNHFKLKGSKNPPNMKLAEMLLNNHKENILKIYQDQNYDNYMTGGGTSKIKGHYKDKFNKYHQMGLFWIPIYKTIEVDKNIR